MNNTRYNRITLFIFIATLLFVLMLAISFWQAFLSAEVSVGAWPFVFLLLALGGVAGIYFFYLQATNADRLEQHLSKRVREERIKLLQEIEKDTEEEDITVEKTNISEKVRLILPKGNYKTVETFAKKLLNNLAAETEMIQGVFYLYTPKNKTYNFLTGYALTREDPPSKFKLGESLGGQTAKSGELMVLSDIPEDYFETESGLGKSMPKYIGLLPIVNEKITLAVIEIATFIEMGDEIKELLTKVSPLIAEKLIQIQKS